MHGLRSTKIGFLRFVASFNIGNVFYTFEELKTAKTNRLKYTIIEFHFVRRI